MLAVALLGAWHWWSYDRAVARAPGDLVTAAPQQVDLDLAPPFEVHGRYLVKRARYELTVRVLRKEIYRFDDGAAIAPVDLAVGWGRMSDSAVLDQLSITQMGRFFYWRAKHPETFSLPQEALITEAAQIHAIPATPSIDDALRHLRPGQIVTLSGYLVDVSGPRGFQWKTSLTRTDTGAGACEIMWIEALAVS